VRFKRHEGIEKGGEEGEKGVMQEKGKAREKRAKIARIIKFIWKGRQPRRVAGGRGGGPAHSKAIQAIPKGEGQGESGKVDGGEKKTLMGEEV